MYCRRCNVLNADEKEFCRKCGASLHWQAVVGPGASRNRQGVIGIVAGLLALVIGLAWAYLPPFAVGSDTVTPVPTTIAGAPEADPTATPSAPSAQTPFAAPGPGAVLPATTPTPLRLPAAQPKLGVPAAAPTQFGGR